MPLREKVFYQSDDVRVTSTRFVVPGQTFSIAAVSSARHAASKSPPLLAAVILVCGLLFGVSGLIGKNTGVSTIGLLLIVAAGFRFAARKTAHHVVLVTGSGETQALSSPNRRLVESVVLALEEAVATQGKVVGCSPPLGKPARRQIKPGREQRITIHRPEDVAMGNPQAEVIPRGKPAARAGSLPSSD